LHKHRSVETLVFETMYNVKFNKNRWLECNINKNMRIIMQHCDIQNLEISIT